MTPVFAQTATGTGAVASGTDSTATGGGAMATGVGSSATGDSSTALGVRAIASHDNSVALGAFSFSSFSFGDARALDGGFSFDLDDGTTATISHTETFDASGEVSFGRARGALSESDPGSKRILTNVADGRVNAESSDGINGAQLHSLARSTAFGISTNANNIGQNGLGISTNANNISQNGLGISTNANNIQSNRQRITRNRKAASSGIAGASAFVEPWSDGTPGTTLAIGAASYDSESAVSLNLGYKPKKNGSS